MKTWAVLLVAAALVLGVCAAPAAKAVEGTSEKVAMEGTSEKVAMEGVSKKKAEGGTAAASEKETISYAVVRPSCTPEHDMCRAEMPSGQPVYYKRCCSGLSCKYYGYHEGLIEWRCKETSVGIVRTIKPVLTWG